MSSSLGLRQVRRKINLLKYRLIRIDVAPESELDIEKEQKLTHQKSDTAGRMVWFSALLVLVLFVSGIQAGSLDGSFGIGGKVATDNLFYDSSQGVFVLLNGKLSSYLRLRR